jgi:hypothetical protein
MHFHQAELDTSVAAMCFSEAETHIKQSLAWTRREEREYRVTGED